MASDPARPWASCGRSSRRSVGCNFDIGLVFAVVAVAPRAGAWVAITCGALSSRTARRRSSRRSVGCNLIGWVITAALPVSLLAQERGLQSPGPVRHGGGVVVAPRAGAWVAMRRSSTAAWASAVAPRAGAWVAMQRGFYGSQGIKSLLAQERGLQSGVREQGGRGCGSLLAQERGLQ